MKTPVKNVTMTPKRGVRWPLTDVLAAMESDTDAPQNFDELDPETKAAIAAEVKKFNMHAHNTEGETVSGVKGDAKALLEMAMLLESDAQSKREQAYRMDPSLRPHKAKTTPVTESGPQADAIDETLELEPVRTKRAPKKAAEL
jgi:NAD(P)H-dependent flavin oxidoreductase YrpB (nitropropane dioxygenase family)